MTRFVHEQGVGSPKIKEHEVNSGLMSEPSPHNLEHITHVGNNNELWKISRESAVRRIEGEKEKF